MSVYIQGVMVTGATTPIGERLIRRLLEDEGIESVLAVGLEPEDEAPLPQGYGDRLTYVSVDLGRSRRVRNLLFGVAKELGVEVVIHTSMHRDAKDSGGRVHAQNVDALRSLLDLGERHPRRRAWLRTIARTRDTHQLGLQVHTFFFADRLEAPAGRLDIDEMQS